MAAGVARAGREESVDSEAASTAQTNVGSAIANALTPVAPYRLVGAIDVGPWGRGTAPRGSSGGRGVCSPPFRRAVWRDLPCSSNRSLPERFTGRARSAAPVLGLSTSSQHVLT